MSLASTACCEVCDSHPQLCSYWACHNSNTGNDNNSTIFSKEKNVCIRLGVVLQTFISITIFSKKVFLTGIILPNSGDVVAAAKAVEEDVCSSSKLIWFNRHGQSLTNVVSKSAREADGLEMSSAQ